VGLLVECPRCHTKNSPKNKACIGKKGACGFGLAKFSGRVWWIEYEIEGRRKRERIGPHKEAAEQRLREVLSARAEGRYINRNPDTKTTFSAIANWYLSLAEVQAKDSYPRDVSSITLHLSPFFGKKFLKDITPALVERYKSQRLQEPSGRTSGTLTASATVNRELACLKTIFNKAIDNGKASKNPAAKVKLFKENNSRDRILEAGEFVRLLAASPAHLKPILMLAYHSAMRQGEVLGLTWGMVDLHERVIKLPPSMTKTEEPRTVPLVPVLVTMFKGMVQGLPHVPVFTYEGLAIGSIRKAFITACKKAGIEDFTFHDLRHTCINNWRLAGHDYFRIMAATGHKTMSVFKGYNTVQREELMKLAGEE